MRKIIILLLTVGIILGCNNTQNKTISDVDLWKLQGNVRNIQTSTYERWNVSYTFGEYLVEDEGDLGQLTRTSFDEYGNVLTSEVYSNFGKARNKITNTYKDGEIIKRRSSDSFLYGIYPNDFQLIPEEKQFNLQNTLVSKTYWEGNIDIEYPSKDSAILTIYAGDGSVNRIVEYTYRNNTLEQQIYSESEELIESLVVNYEEENKIKKVVRNELGEILYKEEIIFLSDKEVETYTYDATDTLTGQKLERFNEQGNLVTLISQWLNEDGEIATEKTQTMEYNSEGLLTYQKVIYNWEIRENSSFRYKYLKFDEEGNWLERVKMSLENNDIEELQRRKITYW